MEANREPIWMESDARGDELGPAEEATTVPILAGPTSMDSGLSSPRSPHSFKFAHIDDNEERPPMWIDYDADNYYVRECYPGYFELITAALTRGMTRITLKGTPGIGKSVFYLYFFDRFRAENPAITVVTAAFAPDCKLIDCIVFEPGKAPRHESSIPSFEDDYVHLYDGIPPSRPLCGRMVCFGYPDPGWLNSMRNLQNHIAITFPPWDLRELLDANVALNLGLDIDGIHMRFEFFGGTARYCLHEDRNFVQDEWDRICFRIGSLQTFEDFRQLVIDFNTKRHDASHSILHSVPVFSRSIGNLPLPLGERLRFGSPLITGMIDAVITERGGADQLARFLTSHSSTQDLATWVRPEPLPESELTEYRNLLRGT